MELNIKQTIAVLVVVILAVSCLIPIINETVRQHDADPLTVPIGAHAVDDLDGWTMDVRKASTGFRISSSMYDGTVTRTGVILSSSAVSVWTDTSRIYTMIGGTVTAGTSLSAIVEDGVMTVNDAPAVLGGIVYVPDEFGALGSYAGQTHGLPMAGIGSYAGVTVGSIADELTGNSSDYVLDVSVTEGDRYGVEYVPGEVDVPESDPFLPDIEHESDPEPEPTEPGELVSSGTTGECTWELDGTVLYIRGTGKMGSYTDAAPAPWGFGITDLIIEEGVTEVGTRAFRLCKDLVNVSLPSTLTSIQNHAFRQTTSLRTIEFPENLSAIQVQAFYNSAIESFILPEGFTYLGGSVITQCINLRHIYIPDSANVLAQSGYHFIRLDGYDMGEIPTGDLYLGTQRYVLYQTLTETIDGAVYRINYIGAELEQSQNVETVHIPYIVEYNGTDYTVESIGHGAISGSSVKNVVIPQTVESISPTAITGSGIKEILNLSATEVTASHGEVRTSVPALAVIAEPVTAKGFGATASMLWIIPLMLVAGAVISIVRGFARARYD